MLVAPPLPSTPPPSSPTPTTAPLARPILAGHALVPTVPTSNSGPTISNAGGRENGSRGFNVFQDTAASTGVVGEDAKGGWDDFGTVKSRKRENEVEAKEWKGETLPMGSKAVGTGFKLDVFRDNVRSPHSAPRIQFLIPPARHRILPSRRPNRWWINKTLFFSAQYADRAKENCCA